jgi:hypothetical protein
MAMAIPITLPLAPIRPDAASIARASRAAIHGSANLIVTFNLKDFPRDQLERYNLVAQHPDDFILDLMNLHPASVCEAAANHRRSLRNPPKTADEYLATLRKQGLKRTVDLLEEWKAVL